MATAVQGLTPLLEVYDLPASIAFYRDVLGFAIVAGDASWWCMLELGGARLMLNTAYEQGMRPAERDPQRASAHGDTSLYVDADPDAVYAHLREKGWPATEPSVTSYGMRQTATKDPDGFQLFFVRANATAEVTGAAVA